MRRPHRRRPRLLLGDGHGPVRRRPRASQAAGRDEHRSRSRRSAIAGGRSSPPSTARRSPADSRWRCCATFESPRPRPCSAIRSSRAGSPRATRRRAPCCRPRSRRSSASRAAWSRPTKPCNSGSFARSERGRGRPRARARQRVAELPRRPCSRPSAARCSSAATCGAFCSRTNSGSSGARCSAPTPSPRRTARPPSSAARRDGAKQMRPHVGLPERGADEGRDRDRDRDQGRGEQVVPLAPPAGDRPGGQRQEQRGQLRERRGGAR